ncbi:TPA: hypothetical protein ACXOK1_003587 [Proteus mirabilis]
MPKNITEDFVSKKADGAGSIMAELLTITEMKNPGLTIFISKFAVG